MKISEYVSYEEATKSQTAIRLNIDNNPNETQLANMKLVAIKCYDIIKSKFPSAFISSFFRCLLLNLKIGGSKTSDHIEGKSVDIDSEKDNREIFFFALNNLKFDQLIWEFGNDKTPDWVHISYREGANRNQVLRAIKVNGKTKYIPFNLKEAA